MAISVDNIVCVVLRELMMIRDGNEKLNGRSKPSSPLALELNVVGLPMHTRNFIPGREQSARGNSHDFRFAVGGGVRF